ncbi:hypothetical protein PMI33_05307, partial [Pseudomonas sp. GM67]
PPPPVGAGLPVMRSNRYTAVQPSPASWLLQNDYRMTEIDPNASAANNITPTVPIVHFNVMRWLSP